MNGVTIRLAGPRDDGAIRALCRSVPMPGAVSLAFSCEPSFSRAIEVQGRDARVVVGESGGAVVGFGLSAVRRCWVNGVPRDIGYLSLLRLAPAFRGSTALARGYRFFAALHREAPQAPFYLTSIMEGNAAARRLLLSGRRGIPPYREAARYETVAIPLVPRRPPAAHGRLRIVDGTEAGAQAIAGCLERNGPRRQFYPVYTRQDIESPGGILRGLSCADFAAACDGGRVVGVLGCWNQLPFRQHIVAGYSGGFRLVRPLVNGLGALAGCAPLPAAGAAMRDILAACIAVDGDDPGVFRLLLRHVLARRARSGSRLLHVGMCAGDPLLPVAKEHLHASVRSRIYVVTVPGGSAEVPSLDGRVPYLELGSL